MKKIVGVCLGILCSSLTFAAYIPMPQDVELMEYLEERVDAKFEVDVNGTITIGNKIVEILPTLDVNSRVYYILDGLYDYIALKVTSYNSSVNQPEPVNAEAETINDDEDDSGEASIVVDLTGENFSFSESQIIVAKGDVVKINFSSTSGYHDRVVDEFNAATAKVNPEDGVVSVIFTADETGIFEYYCSVGSHRVNGMVGNLVVQ